MAKLSQDPSARPEPVYSRRFTTWFHLFFVTVSLAAGGMFVFKLFSFLKTMTRSELEGFAADPILIYAFVAMGFLILLVWSYLTGQFKDIEGPKYEMFERFEEQERQERELARRALDGR